MLNLQFDTFLLNIMSQNQIISHKPMWKRHFTEKPEAKVLKILRSLPEMEGIIKDVGQMHDGKCRI